MNSINTNDTDNTATATPKPHPKLSIDIKQRLALWHSMVYEQNTELLDELLADDVVFNSPTVQRPMPGKELVTHVLKAVLLVTENFSYHREWVQPCSEADSQDSAGQTNNDGWESNGWEMALEFSADLTDTDGKVWQLKAIDLLKFNAEGKVTHIEVMARPMKAVEVLYLKMSEQVGQRVKQATQS